ncbi:MAG TPA: hypothetical protein DCM05_03695 [Elusimicrobia bacterium]|nr:hypothetical protein [Elusimicrobiota bacterium]
MSSNKEEEKKRGGAIPSWMSGSARVGTGTGSGAGVGGRAGLSMIAKVNAFFSSKLASTAIIGMGLAVSGYGLVDMQKRGGFGVEPPAKTPGSLFKPNYSAASTSGLPGGRASGPTALELAYQANKGTLGEGAEAAGKAEEKTQDAAASADKASGEPGAPPSVDPAAMAEQMAAAAGGGGQGAPKMNSNYGKLSSGMGGMAGGGGMASGIGGNFQQPKLTNSALGQASAMRGGPKARVSRSKAPVAARGPNRLSKLNSATGKRLDGMEKALAASRKGNAEMGAATQTQQWSNSQPAGQGIQGAGVSSAGGGQFSDDGVGSSEGPIETETTTPPTTDTEAPPVDGGKNVTPYQSQVDMAVGLLAVACILNIIAALLGWWASSLDAFAGLGETLRAIAEILCYMAAICGAIACLLGVSIMSQGQMGQGMIFTLAGGLTAAMSYVSATGFNKVTTATQHATTVPVTSAISGALSGMGALGGGAAGDGGDSGEKK